MLPRHIERPAFSIDAGVHASCLRQLAIFVALLAVGNSFAFMLTAEIRELRLFGPLPAVEVLHVPTMDRQFPGDEVEMQALAKFVGR